MQGPNAIRVAVPTFNGSRFIAAALASILANDPFHPILICDDRSEDDTLAEVRRVAGNRAMVHINSERLGLGGNWNRCVELAQTPLVNVFHQDDIMLSGHLDWHVQAFADDSDAIGMAASAALVIDEHDREVAASIVARPSLGPCDRLFASGELTRELLWSNPVRCSGVTLLASAHRELGGFNTSLKYTVDWEFWRRLAAAWSVRTLYRPSIAVRTHEATESRRLAQGVDDLVELGGLLDQSLAAAPGDLAGYEGARRRLVAAWLGRLEPALRSGDRETAVRVLEASGGLKGRIVREALLRPRLWPTSAGLLRAAGAVTRNRRESKPA